MSDTDPDHAVLSAPQALDSAGAPNRSVRRATARMRTFADAHGGATATIEYLGRNGVRVILVGADGIHGDVVLSSVELAKRACTSAGLPTVEWSREQSAALVYTAADRRRMAGTGR